MKRPKAPDAMEQVKKAFKGMFRSKSKKATPTPTATGETPAAPHAKPSETNPAAPAPATAPEPATAPTPVTASSAPPQPAPVSAQNESTKDETAALSEVSKPSQSRFPSRTTPFPQSHTASGDDDGNGSRWRLRATHDERSRDPNDKWVPPDAMWEGPI
jgi:hypothetical protein